MQSAMWFCLCGGCSFQAEQLGRNCIHFHENTSVIGFQESISTEQPSNKRLTSIGFSYNIFTYLQIYKAKLGLGFPGFHLIIREKELYSKNNIKLKVQTGSI